MLKPEIFNTINKDVETFCDTLRVQREKAETLYWDQHKLLATTPFQTGYEQQAAIDRLGRLAVAMTALQEAHQAMSLTPRC